MTSQHSKFMEWFKTKKYPANIDLFKVDIKNTRKKCEICSKLTIKTLVRCLVFLLLTLNTFHTFFYFFY